MPPSRPIIPLDPNGYMVVSGEVHTRYATHCLRGQRYRGLDAVFAAVAGTEYRVCATCYPPPPRNASRKRSGAKRAATEVRATLEEDDDGS